VQKNRRVKGVWLGAGWLAICAPLGVSGDQTGRAVTTAPPYAASPSARAGRSATPPDFFAGLSLSDDQKAKIDRIKEETKSHIEVVKKDEKLGPDVKDAMVTGYYRIENSKILAVLTPDQQREVRKRLNDWREKNRQLQHQSRPTQRR